MWWLWIIWWCCLHYAYGKLHFIPAYSTINITHTGPGTATVRVGTDYPYHLSVGSRYHSNTLPTMVEINCNYDPCGATIDIQTSTSTISHTALVATVTVLSFIVSGYTTLTLAQCWDNNSYTYYHNLSKQVSNPKVWVVIWLLAMVYQWL